MAVVVEGWLSMGSSQAMTPLRERALEVEVEVVTTSLVILVVF